MPPRQTQVPDEPLPTAVVVRSLRLPSALDRRLRAVAGQRGIPASTLVRQWVEAELAALEDDQLISRADAVRALATVRPSGPAGMRA